MVHFALFPAGSSVMGRARTQQNSDRIKKISYSSMRIPHKTSGYPVRRNTTRLHNQRNIHARSQPNMRQLGSVSQFENMKMKSIDRDTTSNTISRMAVSQSAPHTPVSGPCHGEGPIFKTTPKLSESEPTVNRSRSTTSPRHYYRNTSSPYFQERRLEANHSLDKGDSLKVKNQTVVPVHSPKSLAKRESKFSLKSPLIKRETKVQLENVKNKMNRMTSLDGANV